MVRLDDAALDDQVGRRRQCLAPGLFTSRTCHQSPSVCRATRSTLLDHYVSVAKRGRTSSSSSEPSASASEWDRTQRDGSNGPRSDRLRRHRSPRLRPPVEDAGRALHVAADRHHRQHGAQRGAADAAEAARGRRPGRHQHPGAVDRRRLRPDLRRTAVHRRRARRPLRPQGCAAGRARRVRGRVDARRLRPGSRRAHRGPGDHGHRRGVRHAVDAVDPHQRLPDPRAGQGDRPVGRHLRQRRGARTTGVGPAARALLVGLGVPRQPADHRRRADRRLGARAEVAATPPSRRSTRSARCCRSSGSAR